ncbi:MAG TPA: sulfite exporter TauE/SafE family protein [Acidimicrobiales bacterium]|nr:sulfite exporter TauE/SafE family protein [Acidimicrobiales bacterium]
MEAVAALSVLFGSIASVVAGFGFALVCSPFLVAAYGAPDGVQINLLVSGILSMLLLFSGWEHLDRPSTVRLLVPAALATVALGIPLRGSDTDGLATVAGGLCLVGVAVVAFGRPLHRVTTRVGTTLVGLVSGAMNVVAGISGPPVVMFGATIGWAPRVARTTLQAYFLGINIVALATLGLPDRVPLVIVLAMVAGLLLGRPLAERLAPERIRSVGLALAAVGSVLAMVRGVT